VLNFPTENEEKRGAFVVGYSILRHSAKTAGQKKEMLCAKFSRRKRRKTRSFCCWLFNSANLCAISGTKKKKCCVLNFPTENEEKRGAFVVGYTILRHSAKSAGQKKKCCMLKFSSENAVKREG
jgi:hypothetical protein